MRCSMPDNRICLASSRARHPPGPDGPNSWMNSGCLPPYYLAGDTKTRLLLPMPNRVELRMEAEGSTSVIHPARPRIGALVHR